MKKRFGIYAATWAVLLALFNVIAFVSVGWAGQEKYTASFWIGYSLISAAFVSQLVCAYHALNEGNVQKIFYRVSLIRASYAGLIATFVAGGLCMLISPLPYWIGVIVCAIVLSVNVLAILKAATVVSEVERIDSKVKQQTFFINSLTVDAESLLARAKSDEARAACKEVYEAVRYSDPMNNDALAGIEAKITAQFSIFTAAVVENNIITVNESATELVILIGERNKRCRLEK